MTKEFFIDGLTRLHADLLSDDLKDHDKVIKAEVLLDLWLGRIAEEGLLDD